MTQIPWNFSPRGDHFVGGSESAQPMGSEGIRRGKLFAIGFLEGERAGESEREVREAEKVRDRIGWVKRTGKTPNY